MKINNNAYELPVLKPLYLKDKFLEKIHGNNKLTSNIIMIVAQDEEYVYFTACQTENDENLADEDYVVAEVFPSEDDL
ncbi:UNVERIFIED_CONTAM: hypothetical protein O8I53_11110 [Campylobacter lari]